MFGLDQLFDFNRNGKLEAFERASEMAFLYSAGRMYDRIGNKAKGTVKLVLPDAVICKLDQ